MCRLAARTFWSRRPPVGLGPSSSLAVCYEKPGVMSAELPGDEETDLRRWPAPHARHDPGSGSTEPNSGVAAADSRGYRFQNGHPHRIRRSSVNTVIEDELRELLPRDVRYSCGRVTLGTGDTRTQLSAFETSVPEEAAKLGDAGVDAVVLACTSASILRGRAYDAALTADLAECSIPPAPSTAGNTITFIERHTISHDGEVAGTGVQRARPGVAAAVRAARLSTMARARFPEHVQYHMARETMVTAGALATVGLGLAAGPERGVNAWRGMAAAAAGFVAAMWSGGPATGVWAPNRGALLIHTVSSAGPAAGVWTLRPRPGR